MPRSGGTPPDRLYGRQRGHKLRPRQQALLDVCLPRLRLPEGFSPPSPLWVEVGFGGGEHSYAQITEHPDICYIACEVFENGICSLLSRLVPEGEESTSSLPANLRIWDDDARHLLRLLPEASVDKFFLLFPDPWPKSRHAKRRFVHRANLEMVARVLKPAAEWRIASDDPTYQRWVNEVMQAQVFFEPCEPVLQRPAGWPPTRYEAKALKAGRQPYYWRFVRRGMAAGTVSA
jgi:tRNA (guanine-N7-)-methyltransferase